MIERYFEEELRYLYESGRVFARAHPDRARFLNIDAVGDRDPYVERLFEGFAFLTGRIREKLDDSFPELTEGLINLMWPAFLKEIPSTVIMELQARRGMLQQTREIERGARLLSDPVGDESAVCQFLTTRPVRMNPIRLMGTERSVDTRNRETLTFQFLLENGISWEQISLSPLSLYLHAELPTAMMLHQFLTRRVVGATITVDDGAHTVAVPPQDATVAGGMDRAETLLPDENRAFRGYMLLLEYFVFPEKFLFVDLHGFESLPPMELPPQKLAYSLTFDSDIPHAFPFDRENFRLHCTPAVNLFKKDTEPLVSTGKENEYRILADADYPRSIKTHSIISVTGIERATGERNTYAPFHNFRSLGKKGKGRTYATHYRMDAHRERTVSLSVGGDQLTGDGQLREETLSIHAWCSNGILPREELREGDINKVGPGFPDFISVANITRPTLPVLPPQKDDYLWVFLSHSSASFTSLARADNLKAFLHVYNWENDESMTRRIDAITEVAVEPAEQVVGGSVIRGVNYMVGIGETHFSDTGDIHLFGQILREFLGRFVSINSFLNLTFRLRPSDKELVWDSMKGERWLI